MKRAWLEPLPEVGAEAALDPLESHHLAAVRRAAVGERIELIDGVGGLALAEIIVCRKDAVAVRILERPQISRESPMILELALAIPHQLSTMDQVLPGLVQLGVNRLWLATSAFSGRLKKDPDRYLTRLREIVRQAMKQSGRLVGPAIEFAAHWEALCIDFQERLAHGVLYHPGYPEVSATAFPAEGLPSLGLLIGAEGGFSEREVAAAEARGIHIHGMGPRILKQETAAIGACYWARQLVALIPE